MFHMSYSPWISRRNHRSIVSRSTCISSVLHCTSSSDETWEKDKMNARSLPYLRMLLILNVGALLFGVAHVLLSSVSSSAESGAQASADYSRHSADFGPGPPLPLPQGGAALDSDEEFPIPNIVHYIWYNTQRKPFLFHHMLSVLSAHKILKPDAIYFHTDMEPVGLYWEQTKLIPSLRVNYRKPPTQLFGETVKTPMFYTSHSNVDRVKVLHEMGGIYLDFDSLVLRPFDDLRRYPCVIAQEQETKACGCIIICKKQSQFLDLWLNSYLDDYRMEEWAYNSGQVPFNLANRFPHLCHIERTRLSRPNFKELDKLWGPETFDWKQNYAIHVYYRLWKDMSPYYIGEDVDPENLKTMNNTFGAMARSIYYGSPELIPVDKIS